MDSPFGDWSYQQQHFQEATWMVANQLVRPAVLFRPRVYIDGNRWCALYGENLQDGVAGFGDSPALALEDFDRQWTTRLSKHTKDEN